MDLADGGFELNDLFIHLPLVVSLDTLEVSSAFLVQSLVVDDCLVGESDGRVLDHQLVDLLDIFTENSNCKEENQELVCVLFRVLFHLKVLGADI